MTKKAVEELHELDWCKILWHYIEDKDFGIQGEILGYNIFTGREAVLWDGTRVDILTDRFAAEVDWASKWTEAVGQAMYYSTQTDRQPGIVLLIKDFKAETKYIYRCKIVCQKLNIKMWLVDCKKSLVIDTNGHKHKLRRL